MEQPACYLFLALPSSLSFSSRCSKKCHGGSDGVSTWPIITIPTPGSSSSSSVKLNAQAHFVWPATTTARGPHTRTKAHNAHGLSTQRGHAQDSLGEVDVVRLHDMSSRAASGDDDATTYLTEPEVDERRVNPPCLRAWAVGEATAVAKEVVEAQDGSSSKQE
nr:unnamed protein product [Digitaria exilis]